MKNRSLSRRQTAFALRPIALALAVAVFAPANAGLIIPETPLVTGSQVPPNIMFILDDSGSMAWNTMPGASSNWQNEFAYSGTVNDAIRYMSSNINKLWYNPNVTYTPGTQADGNSYPSMTLTTLRDDGYQSSGTDSYLYVSSTQKLTASSSWPADGTGTLSSSKIFPVFYVLNSGASAGTSSNYVRYEFRNSSAPGGVSIQFRSCTLKASGAINVCSTPISGTSTTPFKDSTGAYRTVAAEAVNFANWYTYYRTRTLMARTSASIAFGELKENYRVGFDTIWQRGTYQIPVGTDGGLFRNTNRSDWFSALFGAGASGNTPLIPALDRAGQYYSDSSASGPWGPGTGTAQTSCRPSFTILTTDGYWNSGSSSFGNEDNTAGATITGTAGESYTYTATTPYKDNNSTTLADVAMHYWKNDLRADLKNDVPISANDPAFWQHMVTFGIAIGMSGTLDPTSDLPALTAGTKSWPNPMPTENATRIDDLWHATVNSRGSFVSAENPTQFATALRSALLDISSRAANVSSLSANSSSLTTSSVIYQASFHTGSTSGSWSGDVAAYTLNANGNVPVDANGKAVATWKVSEQMPVASARKIYFLKSGSTVEFNTTNLTSAQQTTLGGTDVINYLRGDQSKEQKNGGTLRNRYAVAGHGPLGDVIDSSPVFDATTNTVYFGANDGMLHAVDATSGVERFAVVPTTLFPTLSALSDPLYPHAFYVDGDVVLSNKTLMGSSILVASLGRGGKAVFAVDVTDVANPKILWEYTDTELGLVLGRPTIAKTNAGGTPWAAIVGNGINSTSDRAQLYTLDLTSGALLSKIDTKVGSSNGLFAPRGWDDDGNGTVDYIYAGDLKGNVWKFDFSSSTTSSWATAYGSATSPTPLFVATDASSNLQPITGGMTVALNPRRGSPSFGMKWVFFGTGQFLTEADSTDKSIQTWYGIIDSGTPITAARSSILKQRTVASEDLLSSPKTRKFSTATANDMSGKRGWYLDFTGAAPSYTAYGERAISTPQLLGPTVLNLNSYIPDSDVCQPGGSGWINVIDPFTGGALTTDFFGNGASSIDTGIGGPGKSLLLGSGKLITGGGGTGGNGGGGTCKVANGVSSCDVNLNVATGRISWREIVDTQ